MPKEYRHTNDKLFRLKASGEELAVLYMDAGQKSDKGQVYYVQEKDRAKVSYSGNIRVVTTTVIRTVIVNGKTYTTQTVIHHQK